MKGSIKFLFGNLRHHTLYSRLVGCIAQPFIVSIIAYLFKEGRYFWKTQLRQQLRRTRQILTEHFRKVLYCSWAKAILDSLTKTDTFVELQIAILVLGHTSILVVHSNITFYHIIICRTKLVGCSQCCTTSHITEHTTSILSKPFTKSTESHFLSNLFSCLSKTSSHNISPATRQEVSHKL